MREQVVTTGKREVTMRKQEVITGKQEVTMRTWEVLPNDRAFTSSIQAASLAGRQSGWRVPTPKHSNHAHRSSLRGIARVAALPSMISLKPELVMRDKPFLAWAGMIAESMAVFGQNRFFAQLI